MADQAELKFDEGFMDRIESVEAHAQAAGVVEPTEGALDRPTLLPQAAAVRHATLGELGRDATPPQFVAVGLRAVASVAQQLLGTPSWTSSAPLNRRNRVQEREQLGDVGAVGAGDAHRQRHALRVDQEVVLCARAGAVSGVGADGEAVFPLLEETPTARTDDESTTARDQSSASAWCSWHSSRACRASHTPASCHALRRRQHVMPLPQPISRGSISHGSPLLRMNTIPVRAARSLTRGLPPLGLGASGGNRGSTCNHNSSSTSGLDINPSLTNGFC